MVVVFGGGEDASGRDADVLRNQALGEFEGVDLERQFDPQHKTAFGAGDFGALWEEFDNGFSHTVDGESVLRAHAGEVAFEFAGLQNIGDGELRNRRGGEIGCVFKIFQPIVIALGGNPADTQAW